MLDYAPALFVCVRLFGPIEKLFISVCLAWLSASVSRIESPSSCIAIHVYHSKADHLFKLRAAGTEALIWFARSKPIMCLAQHGIDLTRVGRTAALCLLNKESLSLLLLPLHHCVIIAVAELAAHTHATNWSSLILGPALGPFQSTRRLIPNHAIPQINTQMSCAHPLNYGWFVKVNKTDVFAAKRPN